MKTIKLIISLCTACNFLFSTKAISQNVNEFTGGFSHSVPLITVPSPYGPGVSIGAGYGAGIGVNQKASEIGLGWDINLGGVISRNVSGIPDDWNGAVIADPLKAGFKTQGGVMYFNNSSNYNRESMDFYKSTYKMSSSKFYFPDYDNYSVTGPGIGGSLKPHLFDFASTKLNVVYNVNDPAVAYEIDATYKFKKKMQFNLEGDYAGNFKSRHYPGTPVGVGTTLRYPGYNYVISDAEYTNKTTAYAGVGTVGFDTLTNRLATAKFVEYFTNDSINDDYVVNGFTNIPDLPNRTSTDYEMDGIGAFRITDESGFVYYYTQPVYTNFVIQGNYPLDNNYIPKAYTSGDTTRVTDGNGNYYIKDEGLTIANDTNAFMIEWKQNKRYAYNWLLTAVTGPDYVDTDNSRTVNDGDKGYWVIYDWQLWTKNFTKRIPEYGFNYSFSSDENDNTQDLDITNTSKISGKYGTFSKYDQEVYYLNKVQTASHTAIMVRDVRLDEYSSQPYYYDNQKNTTFNMTDANGTTKTSNFGTLYDDGDAAGNYGINKNLTTTISTPGTDSITVRFNSFVMSDVNDVVKILDGSDNILVTYSTSNLPPATGATFNHSTIKINETTNGSGVAAGFRLSWASTIHPTVVPQLKLSRIILFANKEFATLPGPDSTSAFNISTTVGSFDVSTSGIGKGKFYNETWYNHTLNKNRIESKSIQTVEFNQDYSLARRYAGNVKTTVCATDKLSAPPDVVKGITVPSANYTSSGKLTLNEILTYDVGHVKTVPSVLFDYNKSVTTDNPNYNPVKVDYSGFYKSDASVQGYSGYTTSISKDSTDAWSLRKITSPMGGITEITYESNEYEKVFDGVGGFKGPSKMYMIKSVSSLNGHECNYVLEEDVTTPGDFTALKNSQYTPGMVKHMFVPFVSAVDFQYKYINSDTFTFSGSQLLNIQKFYVAANLGNNYEDLRSSSDRWTFIGNDWKYTGNGYIHFDLPVGTIAYGGGPRVKSIVTKNGTTDAYTREYTYTGGVAPMEFDRFAEEKKTAATASNAAHYLKLRPAEYDHNRMGPGIGYTTVTVKDKGQNNTSNGSLTTTFVTSDKDIDNFKFNIQFTSDTTSHCFCSCLGGPDCAPGSCDAYRDSTYIIEVVDKFSGYWGQVKEMQTIDVNDNILSRTVNTYSTPGQGSIVENYDFLEIKDHVTSWGGSEPGSRTCSQYDRTVCIKRKYHVILSQQTLYSQGISAITEYLTFDPIIGSATKIRTTSPNKGITVNVSSPAFRNSQYAAMGPKSVTSTNANILTPSSYSRSTIDSTITNKSDFGSYTVQTFKKDFKIRMYSVPRIKFIDSSRTNLYWIADRSYNWAGDSTSLSNYGLFKQSNFVAFDYTLASINNKWRLGSENTLLDNSGHVLETKGFNNRFSATKYGYGDTLKVAEASNVNYASFTYSGFEAKVNDFDPGAGTVNYIDGEVKMNNGIKSSEITAHTGKYVLKLVGGTTGANAPAYAVKYISGANENSGLLKGRTYRASVWVHSTSAEDCKLLISLTGAATQSIMKSNAANVTIGSWTLMNVDITVSSTPANNDELKVYLESPTEDAYFDDLRLHPADASMSATVYEPKTDRVSATLDANNFATKYIYDAGGRVTEVWQEIEGVGLKKIKKKQYNYARGLQ
ncbi:MAG: hypothetical protein ACT4ON_04445 [Bacteroidota bacterium]